MAKTHVMDREQLKRLLLGNLLWAAQEIEHVEPDDSGDVLAQLDAETCREYGPRYEPSKWFGRLNETNRSRLRRTLYLLEKEKLVVTWRQWGALSHCKLTDAGRKLAEQIDSEVEMEKANEA